MIHLAGLPNLQYSSAKRIARSLDINGVPLYLVFGHTSTVLIDQTHDRIIQPSNAFQAEDIFPAIAELELSSSTLWLVHTYRRRVVTLYHSG